MQFFNQSQGPFSSACAGHFSNHRSCVLFQYLLFVILIKLFRMVPPFLVFAHLVVVWAILYRSICWLLICRELRGRHHWALTARDVTRRFMNYDNSLSSSEDKHALNKQIMSVTTIVEFRQPWKLETIQIQVNTGVSYNVLPRRYWLTTRYYPNREKKCEN